jgi:ribosomal protein S18 acetylase RimI-like enzyme
LTPAFRVAVAEDAPAIHAMLFEMAAEAGRAVAGTEAALRAHGFGPEPRFRVVLAEADAQALGFVLVFPEYSSWRGQVGLYIQDLYVRPGARGRGLARDLLAAALAAAADWAPAYLTLMVDHCNDAAQAWYARRGFVLRERGDLLVLDGPALARLTEGQG